MLKGAPAWKTTPPTVVAVVTNISYDIIFSYKNEILVILSSWIFLLLPNFLFGLAQIEGKGDW